MLTKLNKFITEIVYQENIGVSNSTLEDIIDRFKVLDTNGKNELLSLVNEDMKQKLTVLIEGGLL